MYVCSPIWVFIGFGEVPTLWTFVGGSVLLLTLAMHEVVMGFRSRQQLENSKTSTDARATTSNNSLRGGAAFGPADHQHAVSATGNPSSSAQEPMWTSLDGLAEPLSANVNE